MKKISIFILIALQFTIIFSCKSLQYHKYGTVYKYNFSPADHINNFLDRNKVVLAAKVFKRTKSFFVDFPEFNSTVIRLKVASKRKIEEQLKYAESLINEVKWPNEISRWSEYKKNIDIIDKKIEAAFQISNCFKEKIYASSIKKTDRKKNDLVNKIVDSVDTSFSNFFLIQKYDFFEEFPIKVNPGIIMDRNIASIIESCKDNFDDFVIFYQKYSKYFNEEFKKKFTNIYFEQLYLTTTNKESLDLNDFSEYTLLAYKNGIINNIIPKEIIAYFITNSKKNNFSFKVNISYEELVNLSKDIYQVNMSDYKLLLNIVPLTSESSQELLDEKEIESEYISGTNTLLNPMYEMALNDYNYLLSEIQRLKTEYAIRSSSADDGWEQLGLSIGAKIAFNKLKEQLDEAKRRLDNTSKYIKENNYTSYSYFLRKIQVSKRCNALITIIDTERQKYIQKKIFFIDRKTFNLAYGLDKKDRNIDSFDYDSESDIYSYLEEKQTIALDRIFEFLSTVKYSSKTYNTDMDLQQLPINWIKENYVEEAISSKVNIATVDESILNSIVILKTLEDHQGTGFYINKDTIVTNEHIVKDSKFVDVIFYNGDTSFGKIIETDLRTDLALIKVNKERAPLKLFNGNNGIKLGTQVIAIGHPAGLEFSHTSGIVSGIREIKSSKLPTGKEVKFIQTDAPINPGNSGGPLLYNDSVIGVNSWKLAAVEIEGISFAIHYDELKVFLKKYEINFSVR